MNPYEILGVRRNATDAQIKAAYRKLVKQFHPDVASGKISDEKIKQVNEAYDILSDPRRKALYDNGPVKQQVVYEEDPREVYRREYIARKRREERQKEERKVARERKIFKMVRVVVMPILVFAVVLEIDKFLPADTYEEVAEMGWQKRFGNIRRSQGLLYSYMKTEHFVIGVPDELHVGYDYWADEKEKLIITASPILKIPHTVSYKLDNERYTVKTHSTVYTQIIPLHFLLLTSALFTVLRKQYSKLNYSLCFLPIMLLVFVLWAMVNEA
jgi:hypothetical protein